MSQKLLVDGLQLVDDLSKFNKSFIKNYHENSDKGYFLKIDVKYLKNLHKLHSDSPFLPERMKINKCNNFVCTVQDKENYVVETRPLKQALNHRLILKKYIG